MIGLFVDHEGMERNNPLARFGNISMVASKSTKVMRVTRDGRQILQISHSVDMHSKNRLFRFSRICLQNLCV
jgi:hypothetical protein